MRCRRRSLPPASTWTLVSARRPQEQSWARRRVINYPGRRAPKLILARARSFIAVATANALAHDNRHGWLAAEPLGRLKTRSDASRRPAPPGRPPSGACAKMMLVARGGRPKERRASCEKEAILGRAHLGPCTIGVSIERARAPRPWCAVGPLWSAPQDGRVALSLRSSSASRRRNRGRVFSQQLGRSPRCAPTKSRPPSRRARAQGAGNCRARGPNLSSGHARVCQRWAPASHC